jgi:hypothetical protein
LDAIATGGERISKEEQMKWTTKSAMAAGVLGLGLVSTATVQAAACLTTASDQVGSPVFGATVQTFIDLGINPLTTCIENSLWANPANFGLGSYVKGAAGFGTGTDNLSLGAYNGAGSLAANANGLDHAWVQNTAPNANPNGATGSAPSQGIVWNLGGQANQVAVFVFVDHGPVPGEVLENTAWLSNDPNAADGGWTQASLVHVYGYGWEADSTSISDGFVAVYQLPSAATFQYVSVTWGGPGAIVRDGDNEIDAVGGLNIEGIGVSVLSVPEPASFALLGLGLVGIGFSRRKQI